MNFMHERMCAMESQHQTCKRLGHGNEYSTFLSICTYNKTQGDRDVGAVQLDAHTHTYRTKQ